VGELIVEFAAELVARILGEALMEFLGRILKSTLFWFLVACGILYWAIWVR
jgi:hypothetical protein